MKIDSVEHIESCFVRGAALAERLKIFVVANGATEHADRVEEIAKRSFPLLLWLMDAEEIECNANAATFYCELTSATLSNTALLRRDISILIRQVLFPVLRPDRHATWPRWWDEVAIPNWVGPFFHSLQLSDRFELCEMLLVNSD